MVPAATLTYWEHELKLDASAAFDLYAGTSTGSIVAASLALGMSAAQVLALFQERTAIIFSREGLTFAEKALSFKGWAKPAYSEHALRESLEEHWGDKTLGECPKPLSIACLDVVTGAPRVFRSAHHAHSGADRNIRVVDAVMASCAAPTFFPSAQVAGSSYIDGALWANNPSLLAILDARDLSGLPLEQNKLLSLGCGKPFWGKNVGFGNLGLVGWGVPLMGLMMVAQSDGVNDHVRRLMPPTCYLRVDPDIPKELVTLDEPENLPSLVVRATETARKTTDAVRTLLS